MTFFLNQETVISATDDNNSHLIPDLLQFIVFYISIEKIEKLARCQNLFHTLAFHYKDCMIIRKDFLLREKTCNECIHFGIFYNMIVL